MGPRKTLPLSGPALVLGEVLAPAALVTALQALATLNNPFVLRQCERFAERLTRLSPEVPAQIELACRWCLARKPTPPEQQRFAAYVQDQWTLGRFTLQGALRFDAGGRVARDAHDLSRPPVLISNTPQRPLVPMEENMNRAASKCRARSPTKRFPSG